MINWLDYKEGDVLDIEIVDFKIWKIHFIKLRYLLL